MPAVAVGETGDANGTEDSAERPRVALLDGTVASSLGVYDLCFFLLAKRAQVELSLEHLAQQLPAASEELVFEIAVTQT